MSGSSHINENAISLQAIDSLIATKTEQRDIDLLESLKKDIQEQIFVASGMKILDVDRIGNITVQFKGYIFEDDFAEAGMKADLTHVEIKHDDYYTLHFDFEPYFEHNKKYFVDAYYPNIHTRGLECKELYNALEAGVYTHKTKIMFGDLEVMTPDQNEEEIRKKLTVIGV